MSWGESVVYWLDNALLSGDATGASVADDCGVLYFALDEQGLARA
jgi:glyoxylase-like metal-dependent hydrolase (beta-lactamase superfamily II)